MTPVCEAIRQRRLLAFNYKGFARVVQPYCYGESVAGHEALRAIQVRGGSSTGRMSSGKLWTVSEMEDIRVLAETFVPNDPNYNPNDRHMRKIVCRVALD